MPLDRPQQLSEEDVVSLARTLGLPLEDGDAEEIRHRINALSEALALLDDGELSKVDPLPLLMRTEEA